MMNAFVVLTDQQIADVLGSKLAKNPAAMAMYSSLFEGITLNPALMTVPIDEHMLHRGDGVFEAFAMRGGQLVRWAQHFGRLKESAAMIELDLPAGIARIPELCEKMAHEVQQSDILFRLFVGRGYGDFSPNPYATVGTQYYLVATELRTLPNDLRLRGARAIRSHVAVKSDRFARVKSLNYLPNVLMKKEAVDHQVDYSLGFTDELYLAEGPTENAVVWLNDSELLIPRSLYRLKGTTMQALIDYLSGPLKALFPDLKIFETDIAYSRLHSAQEIWMTGTTTQIVPIVELDKLPIGLGVPGAIFKRVWPEWQRLEGCNNL